MNNRIFNVNGETFEELCDTLRLAFRIRDVGTKATGYIIDEKKGMILCWADHNEQTRFPSPLNAKQTAILVWAWLEGVSGIECTGWDRDYDGDVSCSKGWRVYCEDWGHVAGKYQAIVAVKPVYLWHGK